MDQKTSPSPAVPGPPEPSNRTAFRRGWLLTMLVVAGTAASYLWNILPDLWSAHPAHKVSDVVFGCAMCGLLCRFVLLGGGFSTGCLTFLYAMLLFPLVIAAAFLPWSAMFPGSLGPGVTSGGLKFHDLGHNLTDTLLFLAVGAWAGFSFWVLFVSRDADLYRRARQRSLAEVELPPLEFPAPRR